jgi:autotransporter passenger strand-loop-strand repeat protein
MASFTAGNGQTSSFLTLGSGESGLVRAGGTASNITVRAGGSEVVSAGGIANGTTLDSGGVQLVLASGNASFAVVSNGGTQTVWGTANFTTVSTGGSQSISSGGSAIATTVSSGGLQTVFNGGQANFTVIAAFDGYQYISSGGTASNTLLSGAGQDYVFAGGSAVSTTMAAGGIDSEVVFSGGTTTGSNLGVGNFQYVVAGGAAISSLVGATSTEYVAGRTTGTQISSGGQQVVSSGGTADQATVLSGGVLVVSAGGQVGNTTLSAGGAIDVTYLSYTSAGSASLAAGTLYVSEGADTYTQTLAGSYVGEYFQTAADGLGGTLITATPNQVSGTPCYCRGTQILTERGEVPVEDLRIGERLITHAGLPRRLIWIGQRSYTAPLLADHREVLPVRIRPGALGDGIPRRDLLVSPLHALYLENVLVPAAALINGVSIAQVETMERVDYFHLELETHDILLAEGAPAESFIDDESRAMFHNAAEYRRLYPKAVRQPARYCAPRVDGGDMLETIRRRLATCAATHGAAPIKLEGRLDLVERARICGWARNATAPEHKLRLCVRDNGVTIAEVLADQERADLTAAGYGHHAFDLVIAGGFSPSARHCIDVRCAESGQSLPDAPAILEPATPAEPIAAAGQTQDRWRGCVDVVTREHIAGWAQDCTQPDRPVDLQILDRGELIAQVLANRYRPDLAEAGIGHGWHSFEMRFSGGLPALSRHVIEVRRAADGGALAPPTVLEAAESFGAGLEHVVAQAVNAASGSFEQERVLAFMLAQTDRLLQQRADQEGHRDTRRTRRRRGLRPAPAGTCRRALVIDQRLPDARRDGGSAAILSHMRALQRLDYSVSFVAAGEMAVSATMLPGGVTHCRAPFYASVEDVLRRQAGCFDLIYLHRVDIAARYLALARVYAPRARILYSVADLHHVRLARQAAVEARPELLAESRRLRLAECTAAWSVDAVICHSPVEVAMLRAAVPEAQVYHVPWDVLPAAAGTPGSGRAGIACLGNYAHAPNLDAARFLVEAVMPLVWQVDAGITCHLVGSEMPAAIRRLERPRIVAVGRVDDLHQVFDRVRLSVAPLRYGAGIKGKVLDSFAAGLPCVMSEIAAEGLPLSPALHACVAADAAGLAELICRLHADDAAHEAAAMAGQSLVAAHFTAQIVTSSLQAAIDGRATAIGWTWRDNSANQHSMIENETSEFLLS